jgi:hypothetical protein
MKLKAIALIFLIALAQSATTYNNLCHNLVKSRLKDIVNFEIGEVHDLADPLKLLPEENDFCESQECLSHRLCYTRFNEFVNHDESLMIAVKQNTQTILTFLETLQDQYEEINSIEEDLTALRSNIRTS